MTTARGVYEDGTVRLLDAPDVRGRHELIVVFLDDAESNDAVHAGLDKWPSGYFEETAGCFRDSQLVRPSQGEFEDRKRFQ